MNLDKQAAMVVFSGGQDSTTCLGWALHNFARVECVTFNYGQRHRRELEAALKVREFFESQVGFTIGHSFVNLGPEVFAGMSPLTNKDEPLETYDNAEQMEEVIGDRVEKTFVPMRNAAFLMLAANRAVVAGCANLVTGVCEADNANYPDCRESFVRHTNTAINFALGLEHVSPQISVQTPLIHASKADTVHLARDLPHTYEALKYSHTAYDGEYPPTGKDHASLLRAQGFERAGLPDPLVLRAWAEGLMELPNTANYDNAAGIMSDWVERHEPASAS